ncbi:hypothetical protein [Methyloversatilis sp.]|uniref:hypothetical protein n=1 Tax=Methyloversatilis sp. TaxID=2569862 RepID=UPI002736FC55|nr:hypothetical protein [Methyloversatilis sp.]MDP2870277.1 hypothetical protein [Methyloversatilis sp.]MDP3288977.1 hypothetical protein [Methyloversatilis sp.]MDP3456549.1 hypothetical protein [Methyloversatilis sp.]MDP3579239.1 hypothetical protein [Methyloversatilis sp.]
MKRYATRPIAADAATAPDCPAEGSGVAQLKHLLDVPAEACFLGFALTHSGTGDYLCRSPDRAHAALCSWSCAPDKAVFFRNWSDTLQAAAVRPEVDIVLIFDIGDALLVFPAR